MPATLTIRIDRGRVFRVRYDVSYNVIKRFVCLVFSFLSRHEKRGGFFSSERHRRQFRYTRYDTYWCAHPTFSFHTNDIKSVGECCTSSTRCRTCFSSARLTFLRLPVSFFVRRLVNNINKYTRVVRNDRTLDGRSRTACFYFNEYDCIVCPSSCLRFVNVYCIDLRRNINSARENRTKRNVNI